MALWRRPVAIGLGILLVVALLVVGEGEAFRLREHGAQDERLAVVRRGVGPRPRVSEGVWGVAGRKSWSVRDNDDEEEDKEDEEEEEVEEDEKDDDDDDDDDDGEEESQEQAAIRKATQERLLRARGGVKGRIRSMEGPVKGGRGVRIPQQEVSGDDAEEQQTEPSSIFNLFGLLSAKRAAIDERATMTTTNDDDRDDGGRAPRKLGGKKRQGGKGSSKHEAEVEDPPAEDDSWLERLKKTLGLGEAEEQQVEPAKAEEDGLFEWLFPSHSADSDKERENPIINLLTSWLQSGENAGDSSEEIRIRPIGSRAEEEDEEDDEKTDGRKKQSGDSTLVRLLNHSPITALFGADDLPTEPPVEAGPKRQKRAVPGPSRVLKQRIAISPEDFEQLLLRVPSFVPDYSRVQGEECRKQGRIFERQLRGRRLWALQMVDASARLASGLLRGNANQLGDFDLCTGIATRVRVREDELVRMRGKYCLAHVDVVAEDAELRLPVHLLQGGGFVKSTLNDPDHFLPRFTTINWGICLPAACSFEDAGSIVEHFVRPYNSTGIKLFLELEEANCHVRQVRTWSRLLKDNWQLVAVLGFYTFVAVVTLVATFNDYEIFIKIEPPSTRDSPTDPPEQRTTNVFHQTLMAFSLKKTLPQLFGVTANEERPNDLPFLDGLKAFASAALFLALRLVPLGFQPFTNRNEFTEHFTAPWSVVLRLLMLYADVFLVVSGFLAAYHMAREYRERARVPWFKRIAGRYLRLAFPLVPVLVFYAWVWEHLGSGPQWGDVVTKNADLCKHGYLSNLLFVHNWYPIEETCAPHTFQLAIEMQLSVLAPFLMVVLVRSPFYGTAAYVLLSALSTAIRFAATTEDRLTPYVFHGVRLTQLYRTLNLSFAETLHRLTPYLAGFGLGYLLQETGRQRHERGVRCAGWLGASIALLWCVIFPLDISRKDFRYEPGDAAQFAALAPLSWALGLCWIIYYCATEQQSRLNRLLSSRPLVCLGRLSYALSLVQFLVFFYFAGSTRGSEVFSFAGYINRTEVCLVLGAALLLTLLFDLPIQNVKRLLDQSGVFEQLETPEPVPAPEKSVEPEIQEEPSVVEESPADFVSPFDGQDEDDGIWLRNRTTEPEEPPAVEVEDFWAQSDEADRSDVPVEPAEDRRKQEPEIVAQEEQEDEEQEEEEQEEEEEEEEEDEEEIDEEKEVKRRPAANGGATWSRL
ncbi:nose resistant to fluoxetine protein 6-like [Anopheles nili]|uniref:nose resistant to fluoxetine protein 6-like n=1 Tax=Anopheles nili TaxID=185578 RepID=UPI00237AD6A5|nr:nose resistant to fluoxetine protein 6-like [Anopheles nili]